MGRDRTRVKRGRRNRAEESSDDVRAGRKKRSDERRRGRTGKPGKGKAIGKPPRKEPQPSVVELEPYTGDVRESRLIEVQPITQALEGSDEVLFGKLAVASGLVTDKQMQACVQVQKELVEDDESDFLGDVLIREKILTRTEVEEILRVQHRNLQKRYKYTRHKRDEALFGRLIRENGYATDSQVNECLRQQAEIERFDEKVPLGELLLSKGYIEEEAVEEILNFQKKRAWTCPHCEAELTISLFEFGRKIRCPECDEKFELPETPESNELKMTARTAKLKKRRKPREQPKAEEAASEAVAEVEEEAPKRPRKKKARTKEKEPGPAPEPAQLAGESSGAEGTPMVKGWFLAMLGRAYGPISLRLTRKLLKLGLFGRDDLFWSGKLEGWTPASRVEVLAPYLPAAGPPPTDEGPPLPAQVTSPKALAQALDELAEQEKLADSDHRKLRKVLKKPHRQP